MVGPKTLHLHPVAPRLCLSPPPDHTHTHAHKKRERENEREIMDIFPFFPALFEGFFSPQNPSHHQDGPIDFSSRPPAWFSYFWSHLMHLLLTGTNCTLAGGVCAERKKGSAVRHRCTLCQGVKFLCWLLLVKNFLFFSCI